MREFIRIKNAHDFLDKAEMALEVNESCNNLMLGIAYSLLHHPNNSDPFFAVVQNDNNVELVALMTPPYKIILYAANDIEDDAFDFFVKNLKVHDINIPGVIGPNIVVEAFQKRWCKMNACDSTKLTLMRVYELTNVIEPKKPKGIFRKAEEKDIPILTEWINQFYLDIYGEDTTQKKDDATLLVQNNDLYVWDNNEIVSMADRRRQTKNGYVVGLVFTPIQFRNNGYATATVAALSQNILKSGKSFCSLFTDLANPTSNNIYQKIGFKPVCDFCDYAFYKRGNN